MRIVLLYSLLVVLGISYGRADPANAEFGSGSNPLIDDDEDYNYVEEQLLEPSTPSVPELPTPTPTFASPMDSDLILPFETMSISSTPSPTPSLPPLLHLQPSTSSLSFQKNPPNSIVIHHSSSINNNDWLHLGSGDSIDIDPTPTLEISIPQPTGSISLSQFNVLPNPNQPPRLLKPINKILVYGGSFHKQRIDNHFQDDSDLHLKYSLNTKDKWIYIIENDLYMLPTVEEVSEYRFNLTAEDSEGLATATDLIISVRQPSKSRLWYFNYQFSFPSFPNWRESIYLNMTPPQSGPGHHHGHGSQSSHQGSSPGHFIVTRVTTEGPTVNLQYVNETLIEYDNCPIDKIQAVAEHYKKQYPDFQYTLTPGMVCDSQRVVNTSKSSNYPPSIKNQIDFINCYNGELFVYKVPADFCYDPEEGRTENLNLTLVDYNHEALKPDNWLQFDSKNREFFAIYVEGSNSNHAVQFKSGNDMIESGGATGAGTAGVSGGKYVLLCIDSHGKEAVDVLDTWITTTDESYNAEFSLHFTAANFYPLAIRKFIEKLSTLFGSDPNQIKIKSYTVDNNIVHFTWYNKSNPGEKEITQLRKVLFSNEGPVDKKVVELFSPEFNISGGNVVPLGKLIGDDTVFHFNNAKNGGEDGIGGESGMGVGGDGSDLDDDVIMSSEYSGYLVTYIIPSVLIAVMVLLSCIIACLLSRKKKLPGDGSEIRKLGGGVPVIFQDELDSEQALLHSNPPPLGPGPPVHSASRSSQPPQQQQQAPPPPPVHRSTSETPPPHSHGSSHSHPKYTHPAPPGYKSVSKYEPPLPPVQYSSSTNKYHHNSNSGILPPPYVPP